jgi:hypothetical protein
MGNGHDSIQGHRNPDVFDGQETYGTKGAYVKYLIKHVDYFYDDSSSKPTYRVTSVQPPLSYRGWLLSEHNRGDYAMPPNPFGDVVPMYGVSLADPHLFYTRADAEMIIKSDDELHKLWHDRLQQTFVSASDAHPRMPNLCMFEPTWYEPFTRTARFAAHSTTSRHTAHTNAKLGILQALVHRVGTRR